MVNGGVFDDVDGSAMSLDSRLRVYADASLYSPLYLPDISTGSVVYHFVGWLIFIGSN